MSESNHPRPAVPTISYSAIAYSVPSLCPPPVILLRQARIFAVAPMALGLIDLVLYALTGNPIFTFIGLLIIFIGLISVVTGFAQLMMYRSRAKHRGLIAPQQLTRQCFTTTLLLLANFPAAVLCLDIGMHLFTRVFMPITVQNTGTTAIEDVTLTTRGHTKHTGKIPPGGTAHIDLHLDENDSLSYTVSQNHSQFGASSIRTWADDDDATGQRATITVHDGVSTHD